MIDIERLGGDLLKLTSQPIPRYRILKDILAFPPGSPDLKKACQGVVSSRWYGELCFTQQSDGSWGRFHTRNSKVKARFPTTEIALTRALALGLDRTDPLLDRTYRYLLSVVEGTQKWPDPPEKHAGWDFNTHTISTATLARLNEQYPLLAEPARYWSEIVKDTFCNGVYDPQLEQKAHYERNPGIPKNKHLKLWSLYPIYLLSTRFAELNEPILDHFLEWIITKPGGIYYVCTDRVDQFPDLHSPHFNSWLSALELLARFPQAKPFLETAADWLMGQQNSNRLWDFGSKANNGYDLPLSASRHNPLDRQVDCTVRILNFLNRVIGLSGNVI